MPSLLEFAFGRLCNDMGWKKHSPCPTCGSNNRDGARLVQVEGGYTIKITVSADQAHCPFMAWATEEAAVSGMRDMIAALEYYNSDLGQAQRRLATP